MMLGGEHRILLVIGRMRGIIGLCLLLFICILLSMLHWWGEDSYEFNTDFYIVFCRLWLFHWICKFLRSLLRRSS